MPIPPQSKHGRFDGIRTHKITEPARAVLDDVLLALLIASAAKLPSWPIIYGGDPLFGFRNTFLAFVLQWERLLYQAEQIR